MNQKLGYYSIGNQIFDSKIEACILAEKLCKHPNLKIDPYNLIKWHFNDKIFSSYDWTIEPEKSLDVLYNERAKIIREKYDYVIISYSGGADSHNMVMSFLNQGLKIDEIIVTHMNKAMENYAILDPHNKAAKYAYFSEYKLQTIFRLKEINQISNKTKITVLDVSDSIFQAFSKKKDESWVFHVREELNPVDASRYNYLQFPSFKKQLDLSKKICILLGVDKPYIRFDYSTNKFYLYFIDRLTNITPIGQYIKDYTNTTIEYFYWDTDCCDLICKQAHRIADYLLSNPSLKEIFSTNTAINAERTLIPLIYNTWDKDWFQSKKASLDWYSEYDSWFIEKYNKSIEYSLWIKGLEYIYKNCPSFVTSYGGLFRFYKKYEFKDG